MTSKNNRVLLIYPTADAQDMTPTLERMYRAMGQDVPRVKRILELNPGHALVSGLRKAHEQNADDPALAEATELLYGSALLAEGGELPDPGAVEKPSQDQHRLGEAAQGPAALAGAAPAAFGVEQPGHEQYRLPPHVQRRGVCDT